MFSRLEEIEVIPPPNPIWPNLTLTLSGGYSADGVGGIVALGNIWTPEVPGVVFVPVMGLCDVVQVGLMGFMAMMQAANCMVVVGSSVTHIPNITG